MRIGRTLPPAAAPISKEDIFSGFKGLLRSDSGINNLQSDLKEYFQVRYCFLTSSGKAALTLILQALHHIYPDRDEVLIPAFTCYSVPSAITRAGLKIRLCDINPETLDYNFGDLQKNLKTPDKLLAAVSTHLFGIPANTGKLRNILNDPQVTIIEDAAQSMGGISGNQYLGTFGDIGFFSLGRGKAFSTVEGGIIITNSDKTAKHIELNIQKLAVQSATTTIKHIAYALALSIMAQPYLYWLPKSAPGLKLGETIYDPQFSMKHFSQFQVDLAGNWKKRIKLFQAVRKKNVLHWINILDKFHWLRPISSGKELAKEALPLLRLPVFVQNSSLRDALIEVSEKRGLGIMPSYPTPIDKIENLEIQNDDQIFPGAEKCASLLVTFPVHGFVSSKDRWRAVESLETLQANLHIESSLPFKTRRK